MKLTNLIKCFWEESDIFQFYQNTDWNEGFSDCIPINKILPEVYKQKKTRNTSNMIKTSIWLTTIRIGNEKPTDKQNSCQIL